MKTVKAGSLISLLMVLVFESKGQMPEKKLYDPKADAARDISAVIQKAKAEHKHVLLEAGGNWCSWCIEFGRFTGSDPFIDSLLGKSYVIYHLNYSEENANKELFAAYGYPQRFGFPVFIVLDENGNRIHTQNSEYLEQGKSYSKEKVMDFLLQWTPQALDPGSYK